MAPKPNHDDDADDLIDDEDLVDVDTDHDGNINFPEAEGTDESAEGEEDSEDRHQDRQRVAGADDEDSDLSEKVRKRIAKERRKRGDLERELAAERAEKEDLRRRLNEAHGHVTTSAVQSIERTAADLKAELKQAIEDGDTDKQLEIEDRLLDVKLELRSAKRLQQEQEVAPRRQEPRQQPSGQVHKTREEHNDEVYASMHPKAQKWARGLKLLDRSPDLIGIAVSVEGALARSGVDPNSDEYYQRLDEQLRRRAPELYDPTDDGDDDLADIEDEETSPRPAAAAPQRRQVQSAVAAPSSRQAAPAAGRARTGSSVKLTPDDHAQMRRFGLDPSNPEHLAEFARNAR